MRGDRKPNLEPVRPVLDAEKLLAGIKLTVIEILRYLPVSAGLSIRRDIQGVEEFYSLISGVEVRMEGFVDLTSFAVLARYKFQAKNMTAMSVQVHGTLLNKSASTGDDYWGLRWEEIPEALRCYETLGLGL